MSYRLDRRQFLASGAALAGATLLGTSTACAPDDVVAPHPTSDPITARVFPLDGDLPEPAVISSVGGILTAAITCSTSPAVIGGRRAREAVTYNGTFPGPTLSVRPGDMIDITFTNRIVFDQVETKPGYGKPPRETNTTNLHYHGMHVSPLGTADNMLVMVRANGKQRYLFQVPLDHPSGLFWYHAHVHGLVTNHVGRGAAGMIYVSNAYTDNIKSLGIRRRLMMLQQAYFDDDRSTIISDDGERDNSDLALSLINGELMPDILMRPGEPQVWSMLNGSTSAFYKIRLEGHTFDVIADDGVPLRTPRVNQETLLMPSGKRLEVVVHGSST
ncbi:MAG TPA: multicopper oxidase domain-containing protein, partial [Gemmatimonadaceae bacterium]|nr:multicopper oxidase domain-containing protein [Gemmatimonadaceae bacterium]